MNRRPNCEGVGAELADSQRQRTRHIVYRCFPLPLGYLRQERAELDAAIRRLEAGPAELWCRRDVLQRSLERDRVHRDYWQAPPR